LRLGGLILTVLAIAGIPVAALLLLAAGGFASVGAALAACAVVLLAGSILGLLWLRDLDVLSETVRRLGEGELASLPGEAPLLPVVERLGHDIDRLSRRLAARAATVERLRRADTAIVEKLPDPLIVLAGDRSVRRANTAARTAFGADLPAVLRHPGLRAAIDRTIAQTNPQTAELTLPVPVPREVHATVVPMDPPMSDGGQIVVVLSDRSRERAVERMRADFVANASHELRTPLASLIGFIDTLRGPAADDPPAQTRFLAIMAEQAARMNRLIDDLLSLSRIELIEHQPPSEVVGLDKLLPPLVAGFEPRLKEHKLTLDLSIAPERPLVIGDADQLAQVVQNLLDNAVKYGREGGTVRVAVQPGSGAPRWPARPGFVLSVADQGHGIPRSQLPRLTERFYRVDKGRSRAVGGTGLGLAIVKHIVSRHRGQMLIESEEGVGTTVSVWLPQMPGGSAAD
jgi:two-component system phosphate regulon sensor histidine kinase PhoR